MAEFCIECRVVRKALGGDLIKAMKNGKSIIIKGIHLDPSIYLVEVLQVLEIMMENNLLTFILMILLRIFGFCLNN